MGDSLKSVYKCNPDMFIDLLINTLPTDFQKRQEKACFIVDDIMLPHGKKELDIYLSELAKIEVNIRELQQTHRDHVVHAVTTFLLGSFIIENSHLQKTVDPFTWKLTSLFHDIAYPIQIANHMLATFRTTIELLSRPRDGRNLKIVSDDLTSLLHNKNSLKLIQNRIDQWKITLDVEDTYQQMIEKGTACHGIYSAIILLDTLDCIYEKKNPNREHRDVIEGNINSNEYIFENEIVDACSAIFLHNLPRESFSPGTIKIELTPIAYLLKICDVLQDWDRPYKGSNGIPADLYDIKIVDNGINFYLLGDRKSKIADELDICKGLKINYFDINTGVLL